MKTWVTHTTKVTLNNLVPKVFQFKLISLETNSYQKSVRFKFVDYSGRADLFGDGRALGDFWLRNVSEQRAIKETDRGHGVLPFNFFLASVAVVTVVGRRIWASNESMTVTLGLAGDGVDTTGRFQSNPRQICVAFQPCRIARPKLLSSPLDGVSITWFCQLDGPEALCRWNT